MRLSVNGRNVGDAAVGTVIDTLDVILKAVGGEKIAVDVADDVAEAVGSVELCQFVEKCHGLTLSSGWIIPTGHVNSNPIGTNVKG